MGPLHSALWGIVLLPSSTAWAEARRMVGQVDPPKARLLRSSLEGRVFGVAITHWKSREEAKDRRNP